MEPDRLGSADPAACPPFQPTASFTYDRVVGVDYRDAPGTSNIEVTVDGGVWKGWIWSISLGDNYFEALEALVKYRCRQGSPALDLLIPLQSSTPCSRLLIRAESEICRIHDQEGLAATVRTGITKHSSPQSEVPRAGPGSQLCGKKGEMLTATFGVSTDGCRDFMLAFGRFLNCIPMAFM